MSANFWWGDNEEGRKVHWKAWHHMQELKSRRGIGFRDLIAFNKTLLAKQIWRILSNPEHLVFKVLKAQYFKHSDIMEATLGSNPSYIWRSLMWSRDVLNEGLCWKVCNGDNINTRRDIWIPQ